MAIYIWIYKRYMMRRTNKQPAPRYRLVKINVQGAKEGTVWKNLFTFELKI